MANNAPLHPTLLPDEQELVLRFILQQIKKDGKCNISSAIQRLCEETKVLTKWQIFAAVKDLKAKGKLSSISSEKPWTFSEGDQEKKRMESLKKMLEDYPRA